MRSSRPQTSLPEQIEAARRKLEPKLEALNRQLQLVVAPAVAEYESMKRDARQEWKRRASELQASVFSEPGRLVGEKIEVWRENKSRVVKVHRHVGPGALFEVQVK